LPCSSLGPVAPPWGRSTIIGQGGRHGLHRYVRDLLGIARIWLTPIIAAAIALVHRSGLMPLDEQADSSP